MGWVNVPGKGRRWQNSDGSYSYAAPGGLARSPIWGQLGQALANPLGAVGAGAFAVPEDWWRGPANPKARIGANTGTPPAIPMRRFERGASQEGGSGSPAPGAPGAGGSQYQSRFQGRSDAVRGAIQSGIWFGSPLANVNREANSQPATRQAPAPASAPAANSTPVGYGAPPVVGTPAARTQRERVNEMLQNAGVQQPMPPMEDLKPYWAQNPEIAKAAAEGPRSTEVGYSERADIQEWMKAMNKTESGRAMVNRFLEQQQKRGLIREQPETIDSYSPAFTQQQLADVDAVQSPAFSKGRDRILAMQGAMVTPPQPSDAWAAGFKDGDPVDWNAAMGASLVTPGGPAARRREDLNRVLEMPGSIVENPPSADPRWAAGYQQSTPMNWEAAAGAKMNIPSVTGDAYRAAPVPTTAPTSSVNWNAAMETNFPQSQGVTGSQFEMGPRYTNPDEQRRYRAGLLLGNQVSNLKQLFRGGQ